MKKDDIIYFINSSNETIEFYKDNSETLIQNMANILKNKLGPRFPNPVTVTNVEIFGNNISVDCEYRCRGFDTTDNYNFPISILDSDDPVKAFNDYLDSKLYL
jgi:hypothetical protein